MGEQFPASETVTANKEANKIQQEPKNQNKKDGRLGRLGKMEHRDWVIKWLDQYTAFMVFKPCSDCSLSRFKDTECPGQPYSTLYTTFFSHIPFLAPPLSNKLSHD